MFNKSKARERFLRDLEVNKVKQRAGCMENWVKLILFALVVYLLMAWITCSFPFNLTGTCLSVPF